ncbi:DUF4271 domain-containing protein [Maribellus comscasis]|uniref:DUF4271 domain-containing protein n=1 Tax=Maribellus comscasis TaxID=2681766 RepID=A0A6I6JPH0_9BACT|nr:DUF4271 domain-containing protein [Maribellus comscasis]QGY44351.1 DUF4271 domain-containing protein [Maribellus comscasis]
MSFIHPHNIFTTPYSTPDNVEEGEIHIEEIYFINSSFQESDTVAKTATDTTPKIEKPTLAQIRYWQRQRENRLVVNGKRYMEPKTEVSLTTSEVASEKGIGLPVRERNAYNTDWLTFVLMAAFILFASVKFSFSKYIDYLFQSVVNYSSSFRMIEEKNYSISSGAVRLEIFFYLTFSVFLFQIISYFNFKFPFGGWILFLLLFGSVLIYFIAKKMVYRAVGKVVEGWEETGEYLFNHDNFNRVAGLVLFPIVVLISFIPIEDIDFLIFTGCVVSVVFYFLLLGRGISILLKKQFSIFYLFLYLCSLEFLPLLLIYKIVVM